MDFPVKKGRTSNRGQPNSNNKIIHDNKKLDLLEKEKIAQNENNPIHKRHGKRDSQPKHQGKIMAPLTNTPMDITQAPLATKLESLQISPEVINKMMPMQRPDKGGTTSIKSFELHANQFPITYNEETIIFHYEITIGLEIVNSELSKGKYHSIKNKLFMSEPNLFPSSSIAYDGHRFMYSVTKLPVGKYKVELQKKNYYAIIEFKKELLFSKLKNMPIPREVLQGLDIIVHQASTCNNNKITVGKKIFSKGSENGHYLGRGIVALLGSNQTIRLTELGPMLILDLAYVPCIKKGPVLNYLEENLRVNLRDVQNISVLLRERINDALEGLKVTVRHRNAKCKFTVNGLTKLGAKDIVFRDDVTKKEKRLLQYYRSRYGIEIQYKRMPCLDLSRECMNYVPMELCDVVEGQSYLRSKLWKEEERKLRDLGTNGPRRRRSMIMDVVNADNGPCSGDMAKNFNISITKEMTKTTARVLDRPILKLTNKNNQPCQFKIKNSDGQYNLFKNKLLKPKSISNWAILDFSSGPAHPSHQPLHVQSFVPNLVQKCHDLGIKLRSAPLFIRESSMKVLSNPTALSEELSNCQQSDDGPRVDLLICPMSDRHDGYRTLKLICDTEIGIVTQCCISFHANCANPKKRDQFFENLALKINAKMGGCNVGLFDGLMPKMEKDGSPFMIIGADVNHPAGFNKSCPSIASMVGSMNWPESNRYASRLRMQTHRVEQILDAGSMCKELIDAYKDVNNLKPEKIIYLRDGVSDGQFDMVLNEELKSIRSAIETVDYKPTFTIIVAQKRHHTRLFPIQDNITRTGNVPPGTVVDTSIVDPALFNFYLCSHYGSLGTSRPTHYYVLHDEHEFSSNELQRFLYGLCFTYARCTKPVSLATPVYYADIAAYRGRMYYEGLMNVRGSGSKTSSSSSLSSVSSERSSECIVLPEVHLRMLNGMSWL